MALGMANSIFQLSGTPRSFALFVKFAISFYNQLTLYLLRVVQYLHYTINMRQTKKMLTGWVGTEDDIKRRRSSI